MPHTTFTNTLTRGTPGPRLPPERLAAADFVCHNALPEDPAPRTPEEGLPAARATCSVGVEVTAGGRVASRAATGGARSAAPGAPVVHVVHTVSVSLCRQRPPPAPHTGRRAAPLLHHYSVSL